MALLPNTKTLSLCSLFLVLLLFMHLHSSNARDMKVQEEQTKQHEATPVSKEEDSYTSGYNAIYTTKKHIHPPQDKTTHGSNQPYHTGYRNPQKEASPVSKNDDSYTSGYNAVYTMRKHVHPSQDETTHGSDQPYLTGYRNSQNEASSVSKEDDTHMVTKPSLTRISFWSNLKPSHEKVIHDSNQPYITGYIKSQKDQKEMGEPYITSYDNGKRLSEPYITSYDGGKKDSKLSTQDSKYSAAYKKTIYDLYAATYGKDSKDSYAATYGKESKDSYAATYKAAYTFKKHIHPSQDEATHGSDQPYLTGYIKSRKDQKEMGEPYITSYDNGKRLSEPYITSYDGGKKDSKVSTQDSKYSAAYKKTIYDLYAATYGKDSKDSYAATYKDSKDSYAATYRKESKDTYAANYKVDHTEAFKSGFFALDDLYVGNRMTLQFPVQDFPHFLSKKEAESIPFSMSQLPSILQLFSIPEDSPEGQAMRNTHEQCELEPLTGESKVCVSSLESMVDFVRSIIGSDVHLDILTSTLPATSSVPLQSFTILGISQDIHAPKWVACHPLPYPYAVFYCHFISTGSKIFKVQLGSENGEQIEALGICHLDTSEWNPGHIIFKQLGFKPGEAPVCHFFPAKHLMWVPLPSKATI